jgi:hypothetical protein
VVSSATTTPSAFPTPASVAPTSPTPPSAPATDIATEQPTITRDTKQIKVGMSEEVVSRFMGQSDASRTVDGVSYEIYGDVGVKYNQQGIVTGLMDAIDVPPLPVPMTTYTERQPDGSWKTFTVPVTAKTIVVFDNNYKVLALYQGIQSDVAISGANITWNNGANKIDVTQNAIVFDSVYSVNVGDILTIATINYANKSVFFNVPDGYTVQNGKLVIAKRSVKDVAQNVLKKGMSFSEIKQMLGYEGAQVNTPYLCYLYQEDGHKLYITVDKNTDNVKSWDYI